MSKNFNLKQEISMDNACLKKQLGIAAQNYNLYVGKKLLFIHCDKQNNEYIYDCFEAEYGKENFMHLAGFQKDKLSAERFFEKCLDGSIMPSEFSFKESRLAASSKLSVLADLLEYQHVKIYKIGEKDSGTIKNQFRVGLGNNNGIIGFDNRKSFSSLPIPISVMKRPLTDYVSKPEKIIAILSKNYNERFYGTVIGTVKQGLPVSDLPSFIQHKLSPEILKNGKI